MVLFGSTCKSSCRVQEVCGSNPTHIKVRTGLVCIFGIFKRKLKKNSTVTSSIYLNRMYSGHFKFHHTFDTQGLLFCWQSSFHNVIHLNRFHVLFIKRTYCTSNVTSKWQGNATITARVWIYSMPTLFL